MLRSRIAAAAVGVAVLGVSAALVPTASNAETVQAASPVVTWTDRASDFTAAPATNVPLTDKWYWGDLSNPAATTGSITDHATLDADGLSVSSGEAVGVLRGVTAPIAPSDLASVVADASAAASGEAHFALVLQADDDATQQTAAVAVGDTGAGLQGAATEWSIEGSPSLSTADLATELQQANFEVVGYIVYLGLDVTVPTETTPPAERTPATEPVAPEATSAATSAATPTADPSAPAPVQELQQVSPQQRLLAAPEAEATPDAGDVTIQAAPDASASLASLRFDDTTTYFTPRPTAAVELLSTSATVTEATTTGIRVQGSGFAPGEVVDAGVGTTGKGTDIPGSLVADAAGNVSGVVVLPADFVVDPGTYTVTLIGASSGQSAQATVTITADPAAPAVPVTGTATFTG